MPLRPRDIPSADLRFLCGFSLFVAWLVLLPRTVMANSTVVHAHALELGCAFVALFALWTAIYAAWAGREARPLFALCALAGTAGGFAFLALPGVAARLACFTAETAAGIGLLLYWGRMLSERSLGFLFACALGALATTAAFHFLVAGIGAVVSVSGNAHALSDLMLGALALLPVASGALGWPATRSVPVRAATPNEERTDGGARSPVPLSYLVILCLASIIASFVSGFTYLPHYVDWNLAACLRSAIVLAIALAMAWYLQRKAVIALSHANVLLLASLLLTVLGLLALTVGAPMAAIAARGMLDAARDCYFAAAVVMLCRLVRECRLPFLPAFVLGMLGTGLYWAYDLGAYAKRLLGYDLQTLAPLSAACIAILAVAFFLLFVRGPGRASEPPENAAVARSCDTDPKARNEAPVDDATAVEDERKALEPEPEPEPLLDAASARQIIEKTHEDVLAPYQLSPRELQVSMLVLDGYTAAAASERLGISIATVKFHLGNAYRKIGIQSKSELIQLAKSGEGDNANGTREEPPYVD